MEKMDTSSAAAEERDAVSDAIFTAVASARAAVVASAVCSMTALVEVAKIVIPVEKSTTPGQCNARSSSSRSIIPGGIPVSDRVMGGTSASSASSLFQGCALWPEGKRNNPRVQCVDDVATPAAPPAAMPPAGSTKKVRARRASTCPGGGAPVAAGLRERNGRPAGAKTKAEDSSLKKSVSKGKGKRKTISSCEHIDAPHYCKGFCRACYMKQYNRAKRSGREAVQLGPKKRSTAAVTPSADWAPVARSAHGRRISIGAGSQPAPSESAPAANAPSPSSPSAVASSENASLVGAPSVARRMGLGPRRCKGWKKHHEDDESERVNGDKKRVVKSTRRSAPESLEATGDTNAAVMGAGTSTATSGTREKVVTSCDRSNRQAVLGVEPHAAGASVRNSTSYGDAEVATKKRSRPADGNQLVSSDNGEASTVPVAAKKAKV